MSEAGVNRLIKRINVEITANGLGVTHQRIKGLQKSKIGNHWGKTGGLWIEIGLQWSHDIGGREVESTAVRQLKNPILQASLWQKLWQDRVSVSSQSISMCMTVPEQITDEVLMQVWAIILGQCSSVICFVTNKYALTENLSGSVLWAYFNHYLTAWAK